MPEGPELHLAARYINTVCGKLLFSGQVEKSEVSKNSEVPFASQSFRICAESRGKEVKLSLIPIKGEKKSPPKGRAQPHGSVPEEEEEPMDIVFRFGMSGCFKLTPADEVPKHAHLRFYTEGIPRRALCFVDVRRFGSWEVHGAWQPDRGPCVMLEYEKFRENVIRNLQDKAFDKPICEALLNQKYFNGIGNYLRAEILYRLKIPPFEKARTVLESLGKTELGSELTLSKKLKLKKENPDLLELCHLVPLEVIQLGGKGYDPEHSTDYSVFEKWLQCYYAPGMKSLRDSNGRTIWFQGEPGPLAPKGQKKNIKRVVWPKQEPNATGLKETKPKGKRKSQGSGTRKGSVGTNEEPPKKLARRKAQESTRTQSSSATRKRKLSLRDSNTPQAKGRILGSRRGGKTVTVKGSPRNTPLAKKRSHQLKKEVEPIALAEDASKDSQLVKGRKGKLKKEEEPVPVTEDASKDSQLVKGRKKKLKKEEEPVPVTEDASKDSQLVKGRKGKLKMEEEPVPVTEDASKDSQLLKGRKGKLKKEEEPVPVTEDASKDAQLEKGMSLQLKKVGPLPATQDSLNDFQLPKGRTQQLKKEVEPVPVIEDSSKHSQLAKVRKIKPKKGEPAPVTEESSKDSQLEDGMSQQHTKDGGPVPLTEDSLKNSQLETINNHLPLVKEMALQPSSRKRAGSPSIGRRNPRRVKAE